MIFDFRRDITVMEPLMIKNEVVELTDEYKYLGMTIDNKFNWDRNLEAITRKANQRLYFLRKLKSFRVDKKIMNIFYTSSIQSLISFGIICYGGNLNMSHIKKLNRIIKNASQIMNSHNRSFFELYNDATSKKANTILEDTNHPLHSEYIKSTRSHRLLSKKARTDRYKNSFIPTSTRLLQQNTPRTPKSPT